MQFIQQSPVGGRRGGDVRPHEDGVQTDALDVGPGDGQGLSLPDDTLNVLEKYTALTERNKGRLEQFLDTLYEQQAQQKEAQ